MPFDITSLIPFLKSVVEGLGKFFTTLFLLKQGEKTQKLKQAKEEIEDAKEAQKSKSGISALSDDDLDKLL